MADTTKLHANGAEPEFGVLSLDAIQYVNRRGDSPELEADIRGLIAERDELFKSSLRLESDGKLAAAFNAGTIASMQAALRDAEARTRVLERRLSALDEVLDEIAELLDRYSDAEVVDGRPRQNDASRLLRDLRAARAVKP